MSSEGDTLAGSATLVTRATENDSWAISAPPVRTRKLEPGTVLADRYEILEVLGEGGMGAVYKAHDRELDRVVALKVIRPELVGSPKILQRFKQELILARQVTHKNVIRIFDIGSAEGFKFITMEHIEGRDLASFAGGQKVAPLEAARIMRQVGRALEAAHSEGVIHRDLKPQNVMVGEQGRVWVMDFGLARSVEMSGLTQTGAMLGTPAYMSPEQARCGPVDPRSDLFAFGIIFYELLTGKLPYEADTMLGSLLKRTQEPATPPIEADPSVPQALSDIVVRCLAINPAQRYQSAAELLADMDAFLGGATPLERSAPTLLERPAPTKPARRRVSRRAWLVTMATIVVIVAGVLFVLSRALTRGGAHAPVSVLVADFSNHTGDPVFDGTLEPMFNVALEGASFINAFSRGDARRLARKLPNPTDKLDDQSARLVAVGQGLGIVVSGSLERQGEGYQVLIKAIRAVTGETIANAQVEAANKDQVLFAATKAAAAIRKALGDTTSESDQLYAMETLTATSLEAVHEYSLGLDALVAGKHADALRSFSRAADLDPNFGLAMAGKASAARNLGETDLAIGSIKQAIQHIDRMTERERYRTRGMFYLITHNDQKCVEEYGALAKRYPSDVGAHANIGVCWGNLRNMANATQEMQRASQIMPKRVPYRFNVALFETLSGDFVAAEREAQATLNMEPASLKGYVILGLAQLGQDRLQEAAASYRNAEKVSDVGASVAAAGLADLAAYQGRFAESARILEQAAAADLKAKRMDRAADKYAALATTELFRGRNEAAQEAVKRALDNSKAVKVRAIAGIVLAQTGATARARELSAGLASELQAEPQAYAKLVDGEIALKNGNARDAIQAFTNANGLLDTWIGRFDLGRAYLAGGAFAEADSEFDRCLKRRAEALLIFMDDVPTYAFFPLVYYYQGRVREGLKSSGFAESYRKYLSIRSDSAEDPLLPEIRRRVGQ